MSIVPQDPDSKLDPLASDLREQIASTLWHAQPEYFVSPWPEISETTRERYRTKADALLAGPLAVMVGRFAAAIAELEARADEIESKFRCVDSPVGQRRYAEGSGMRQALEIFRRALAGDV